MALSVAGVASVACRSAQSEPEMGAAGPPDPHSAVITDTDAERARAAIREEREEMAGERRPAAPPPSRPVDQPPARR